MKIGGIIYPDLGPHDHIRSCGDSGFELTCAKCEAVVAKYDNLKDAQNSRHIFVYEECWYHGDEEALKIKWPTPYELAMRKQDSRGW